LQLPRSRGAPVVVRELRSLGTARGRLTSVDQIARRRRARVRAAFFAAAERAPALRLFAAVFAGLDSAARDTVAVLSRRNAFSVACARLRDGFLPAAALSCFALRRVSAL